MSRFDYPERASELAKTLRRAEIFRQLDELESQLRDGVEPAELLDTIHKVQDLEEELRLL